MTQLHPIVELTLGQLTYGEKGSYRLSAVAIEKISQALETIATPAMKTAAIQELWRVATMLSRQNGREAAQAIVRLLTDRESAEADETVNAHFRAQKALERRSRDARHQEKLGLSVVSASAPGLFNRTPQGAIPLKSFGPQSLARPLPRARGLVVGKVIAR